MQQANPDTTDLLQERLEAQKARQLERNAQDTAADSGGSTSQDKRRRTNRWQRWMRWIHAYTSMIAFLVILFFGITGILLNHPSWIYGDDITTTLFEGTMPDSVRAADGDVEFLAVSEFMRSEHGVSGEVTNFDQVGNEGSINYTGPGYGATVRFDVGSLEYNTTLREEGFVNAMRDLHTGSDTRGMWDWLIDISAGFLVFVSLSGLGIQLLMRKNRNTALALLAAGTLLTVLIMWLTMV